MATFGQASRLSKARNVLSRGGYTCSNEPVDVYSVSLFSDDEDEGMRTTGTTTSSDMSEEEGKSDSGGVYFTCSPASPMMTRALPASPVAKRSPSSPTMRRSPVSPSVARSPASPSMGRLPASPSMGRSPASPSMGRSPASPVTSRRPAPMSPVPLRRSSDPGSFKTIPTFNSSRQSFDMNRNTGVSSQRSSPRRTPTLSHTRLDELSRPKGAMAVRSEAESIRERTKRVHEAMLQQQQHPQCLNKPVELTRKRTGSQPQLIIDKLRQPQQPNRLDDRAVRVVVRCCRLPSPLCVPALKVSSPTCLEIDETCLSSLDASYILPSGGQDFCFDKVLGPTASQDDVFQSVSDVVDRFATEKKSGAIIAYGQTASGKTHTMGLLPGALGNTAGLGCIPRAITRVFRDAPTVKISAVELYIDQVRDLLAGSDASNEADDGSGGTYVTESLSIRERLGKAYVQGLREVECRSAVECWKCVQQVAQRRAQKGTEMNKASSRSHTIISLSMDGAVLNLVDLAGSERVHRTLGDLKEIGYINSSLAALGNVVRALATTPVPAHVPYRDAKLTRLLQQSLQEGNVALIATVSMDPRNVLESISTLRFAERCLHVKPMPVPVPASPNLDDDTDKSFEAAQKQEQRAWLWVHKGFRALQKAMRGTEETKIPEALELKNWSDEQLDDMLSKLLSTKPQPFRSSYESNAFDYEETKGESKMMDENKIADSDGEMRGMDDLEDCESIDEDYSIL